MKDESVTAQTSAQFVRHVSEQSHAMAGAVIALSAAQAAALGQACMQISVNLTNTSQEINDSPIEQMNQIKETLLQLTDRDAGAIAEYVALREAGKTLAGQQLLCRTPAEIGQLSVKTAQILQDFRSQVNERVQDDLEMSISLLASTAQAAMLLLDSNLRIWPEQPLLAEFEPIREELEQEIFLLTPVKRIRQLN